MIFFVFYFLPFYFASPLFFFLLFLFFLLSFTQWILRTYIRTYVRVFCKWKRKCFFFSVQGVLRCYNNTSFKLDCWWIKLVFWWCGACFDVVVFNVVFFFFLFYYPCGITVKLINFCLFYVSSVDACYNGSEKLKWKWKRLESSLRIASYPMKSLL